MTKGRWLTGITLVLMQAVLAQPTAPAGDKLRLREEVARGDLSVQSETIKLSFSMKAATSEGELGPFTFESLEKQVYTESVLESNPKEGVSTIRRIYGVHSTQDTDPGGETTTKTSSLQGKTVTIRKTRRGVTVEVERGEISEEDRRDLIEDAGLPDIDFFPDRALSPGETWTVAPKAAEVLFPGAKSVTLKARFEGVVEQEGSRRARVHLDLEAVGEFPDSSLTFRLQAAGESLLDLKHNRGLSMALKGPMTVTGTQTTENGELTLSGTGTAEFSQTTRWLKVAGKAVAKAPEASSQKPAKR